MAALRQNINLGFVLLVFLLMPALAHAGGLGLAPAVAIAGIASVITVVRGKVRDVPAWMWALGGFLIWSVLSAIWSPYDDPQLLNNPAKLLLGAGLYLAFDQGVKRAMDKALVWLRRWVTGFFVFGVIVLLIDLVFPYVVTYTLDPLGAGEDPNKKAGDVIMNLGHAIAVYTLVFCFIPAMWKRRGHGEIGAVSAIAIVLMLLGLKNGFEAGYLAALAAALSYIIAQKYPRFMFIALTASAIVLIFAAPLIGILSGMMSDDMLSKLPFSWEHRLGMWEYTLGKIAEAPLFGHGFDAVRTFEETYMIRGFELPYISLHPHNAGLHIWTETGLVGAALASLTVFFMCKAGLHAISDRPELAPALSGFGAATLVIGAVTYGVWQEWWWALIVLAASLRHLIPATKLAINS